MASITLHADPVVICPYNSNHLIARSRIQKHLVKCEKNYPPNFKLICPYDATHRFFEHELEAHIESCPMKVVKADQAEIARMPETNIMDVDSIVTIEQDEWEEDQTVAEQLPKEPTFEFIRPTQHVTVTSVRGNAITARRISNALRRPLGLSECMMLECSDASVKDHGDDDDDDTESFNSEMSCGRGRALLNRLPVRGIGTFHRRGCRGRLI